MLQDKHFLRNVGTPETLAESEEDFQSWVIDLAHVNGWRVAHFRPAMTKKGWRTAVSADGEGFPDLLLTRGPVTIYAETKSKKGQITPEQKSWLEALAQNPGNQCFVWRPADRQKIEEVLSHGQ